MEHQNHRAFRFLPLGLLFAALIVLFGAAAVQSNGRYQVAVGGPSGWGVFAIDTASGVTKAVCLNTGDREGFENHLGQPFREVP